MDVYFDDRLDGISIETVALPKLLVFMPFLLGVVFLLVTLVMVNDVRQRFIADSREQVYEDTVREHAFEQNSKRHTIDQNTLAPWFTPEIHRWTDEIGLWSEEYQIPENLIAVVMQIESCGNPNVESNAGAIGLFQVMPYHFGYNEDPFDVQTNARRGLTYLSDALELGGGRIDLALAGYNGGHSQIKADPAYWPDETMRYVRWGFGMWEDIEGDRDTSPTLHSWLAAGGNNLCQRAREG